MQVSVSLRKVSPEKSDDASGLTQILLIGPRDRQDVVSINAAAKSGSKIVLSQSRTSPMPEYLIDTYAMATFWVTASTEEEAVNHVRGLTEGLDCYQQDGRETCVIGCRDRLPFGFALPACLKPLNMARFSRQFVSDLRPRAARHSAIGQEQTGNLATSSKWPFLLSPNP